MSTDRPKKKDEGARSWSLENISRHADRLFHEVADETRKGLEAAARAIGGWTPSLDVLNGEKEITVRAELPGVDPDDVRLEISGNVLTISGEKRSSVEVRSQDSYRMESRYGAFRRSVSLPSGADPDRVSAEHSNGVLTVHIGKAKGTQGRRIQIDRK